MTADKGENYESSCERYFCELILPVEFIISFWGGRMIALVFRPGRKVRTPQGAVVPNGNAGKPGESATENTPPMERATVHR